MRCLAVASRVLEAQGHLCLPGALVGRVSWCDTHGLPASESYYEPVTHLPAPSGWGLRIHWENMWGFFCAPWNKGSLDVVKNWLSIRMERVSRNQREQAVPVVREFTSRRLVRLFCTCYVGCCYYVKTKQNEINPVPALRRTGPLHGCSTIPKVDNTWFPPHQNQKCSLTTVPTVASGSWGVSSSIRLWGSFLT